MIGTDRVQPIGRCLPKLARVQIRIGPPIQPPAHEPSATGQQARELTEQIMSAIASLSMQDRTDLDCAEHKSRLASQPERSLRTEPVPSEAH
jgi:hypothetical protein